LASNFLTISKFVFIPLPHLSHALPLISGQVQVAKNILSLLSDAASLPPWSKGDIR
jgi:hypothetical protein